MHHGIQDALLQALETQYTRGGKSFTRGLIAALIAAILALVINLKSSPSTMTVPGLGFELSAPLGCIALLLVSFGFGFVVVYHAFRLSGLRDQLYLVINSDSSVEAREEFAARWFAAWQQAPALLGSIAVCSMGIAACFFLHFIAFYFLIRRSIVGEVPDPAFLAHWWVRGLFAFGYASVTCMGYILTGFIFSIFVQKARALVKNGSLGN